MGAEILTHTFRAPPVYQLFVYARPTSSGKGKKAYVNAVGAEATRRANEVIEASDVEITVLYSSARPPLLRTDVDNILKPTLDALCGKVYRDDRQVRAVSVRLIDRTRPSLLRLDTKLAHLLINSLFHSGADDVVVIHVYSESRLKKEGWEEAERRVTAEAAAETDRVFRDRPNTKQLGDA